MMRHLEALVVALLIPLPAFAQAPALLPVQGLLTDADGAAIDGSRGVTFRLYDVDTGGTALFTETQTIDLEAGLFTTYLGTGAALDLGVFTGDRWLGVTVESDAEMPRFRLGTTPFAAFAQTCGDAATLAGASATDFATAAHVHDYADLPADLADGDDVLTEAEVDAFANDNGYAASAPLAAPGTINTLTNPVDWTKLKGVPAGLADGTDANTTYTAGTGILINANQIATDPAAITSAAQAACFNTEAELTALLDNNYQATLTTASNVSTNSLDTAVVDLRTGAQWNNSASNGVTEMNIFTHASCDATTRGRFRLWVLEDIGNSMDLGDALCYCQEYTDRTPAVPVTSYRWACMYPQSDGN